MYRLMLVDDEPDIRDGLREVVDFAALGFVVVGEAGNGLEALRLAETLRPDLIITDIRMPLMDGLAMAAEVRKLLPTTQFVILSGYDDFEYARQAIELTALRYLLKPISSREFIEVMQDVRRRMDEDFQRRSDLSQLRAHFEYSLPLLRKTLLSSLLTGELHEAQARAQADRYGLPLQSEGYILALIRVLPGPDSIGEGDPELLAFAVTNIAEEILGAQVQAHVFQHAGDQAALLLCGDTSRQAVDRAVSALETLRANILHYLRCEAFIGVSAPCAALSALPGCARQAHAALGQASLLAESQVVCITDMAPGSGSALSMDEYALRSLGNSLKLGDAAQAEAVARQLLDACRQRTVSMPEYRAYLLEILLVFIRVARDLDLPSPADVQQDMLEELMLCPPLSQAEARITALCSHIAQAVADNRATSSRHLAQQAEAYLQAHYTEEDLTVEKLCGHLHISTSYFSALFKKETRRTFSQYLSTLRMDQAMTLLASSDLRTADIAGRVGIGDPGYFSYAFKKHFGLSPSQVRKQAEGRP